ncbi:MAG: hypothetical protein OEV55_10520 [candidate division Zixibacteria bacterium]|nr:hypothetical protein [candidate division Zixibacteria bacterium]
MIEKNNYRNLNRCPVKVLILDTHIISNMAKWKMGKQMDKATLERVKILYEYIHRLVRAKKLLCPEIPILQDEYRLDTRIEETCEIIVIELSRGVRFLTHQNAEDFQIQLAMKAYIENSVSVDYSKEWYNIYSGDPIKQLLNCDSHVFRFSWSKKIRDNEHIRERKRFMKDKLRRIKAKDASRTPTFEEKLNEEYNGYITGILKLGFLPYTKEINGKIYFFKNMMGWSILSRHLAYWERLKGQPAGIKEILRFYRSEYLRSVPSIEIQAKLWAGFAVYLKSAKPKESDANDIAILATVLPYADFIILDKTIADLARDRLHLDKKYNTKIYKLSETDKLVLELQQIEKIENPLDNLFA